MPGVPTYLSRIKAILGLGAVVFESPLQFANDALKAAFKSHLGLVGMDVGAPITAADVADATASGRALLTGAAGALHIRRDVTTLTGGASNALDSIATAGGVSPQAVLISAVGKSRLWELVQDATSPAENATDGPIKPDDYHASTNPYVWKPML